MSQTTWNYFLINFKNEKLLKFYNLYFKIIKFALKLINSIFF